MTQPTFTASMKHIAPALLALGILGSCILYFYPSTHTLGGLHLESNDEQITARSREFLASLGFDAGQFRETTMLMSDNALLARLYDRHGVIETNRMLRQQVPGYFWKLRLLRKDESLNPLSGSKSGDEAKLVQRVMRGDLMLHFDMKGRLLRIDVPLDDSLTAPSLRASEAYALLRRVLVPAAAPARIAPLARLESFSDSGSDTQAGIGLLTSRQQHRVDHLFSWSVYDRASGDTVDVRAMVKGNVLARFEAVSRFRNDAATASPTGIVDIFEVAYYLVFGAILVVVFFRRMRSEELGFRPAFVMGGFIALLFGTWMYFELSNQMEPSLELLIPLLIAPLFVGAGFVPLWAVGESLGRETWKEKLLTFDLLRAGDFFHSRIGRALLWGTVAGAGMLAVGLLAARLFGGVDTVWISQSSNDGVRPFSTPSPALYVIGSALITSLFAAAFMLLGVVSIARQRLPSTLLVIALPVLLFTLVDLPNLVPLPAAWLVLLPVMLLLVWLFVGTDLLTAFTAFVVFSILGDGLPFLLPGGAYPGDAMLLAAAPAVLVAWAIAALLTPDRVRDLESIAPRYQRHITERQRLARELEIARDVQMGFLPKRNPIVHGLDIASHCAPALEVGGDYYDFIELGEGRIGIAIGDVSGKGTQAAFYMTLTKGFLQALAWQHDSPAAVLTEMNRLFYRNVERGHFISMIYAVFDTQARELRIARAGHTPVLRRSADAEVAPIQSRGIALGFEAGETFTATIEEIAVPLKTGDVFLLYTDGYPETMTRKREEYGEERLALALRDFGGGSAEQLLSQLYRDTRRFAGRAEQHDDMTMVVVRVL